jgi:hypothetical protein
VIQGDSPSREPPLAFHFLPPRGVSPYSNVSRWSLSQQHYRVTSEYKTDWCSTRSCHTLSNGTLRRVEPAVSRGQHSMTQGNSTLDYLVKRILDSKVIL